MSHDGEETTSPKTEATVGGSVEWRKHMVVAGPHSWFGDEEPVSQAHRPRIEPWLTALVQAEHLCLLVGNGLSLSIAHEVDADAADISASDFGSEFSDKVISRANYAARLMGRGQPNFEDQVRTVNELIAGLRVIGEGVNQTGSSEGTEIGGETLYSVGDLASIGASWQVELDNRFKELVRSVLKMERGIRETMVAPSKDGDRVRMLLGGFLLAFASRTATRERLQIFTTNYDRLIEYGCDLLGLRIIDRFQGTLEPVFRSSRLGIDMHYNPPGMRGEPRYLEGIVRLTKLHGSLDWCWARGQSGASEVVKKGIPFGAERDHPGFPASLSDSLLIYPNSAKDVETSEYPYAELFRDFAASACQPNVVLVTYGYGFGDDHINRVLRDMLTIPSTHLVIVSYGSAEKRIRAFYEKAGRDQQISLLIGTHFGHLPTLVDHYLPKPAIDRSTLRMADLLSRRSAGATKEGPDDSKTDDGDSA